MNTIIENIRLFFQKLGEIIHSYFHKKDEDLPVDMFDTKEDEE